MGKKPRQKTVILVLVAKTRPTFTVHVHEAWTTQAEAYRALAYWCLEIVGKTWGSEAAQAVTKLKTMGFAQDHERVVQAFFSTQQDGWEMSMIETPVFGRGRVESSGLQAVPS